MPCLFSLTVLCLASSARPCCALPCTLDSDLCCRPTANARHAQHGALRSHLPDPTLCPACPLQIIQLYEMIVVRHGLMVVGLPFSGKTAAYRVLAAALNIMHERGQDGQEAAQYYVVNPKSVTIGRLYGQVQTGLRRCSHPLVCTQLWQAEDSVRCVLAAVNPL